MSLFDKMKKHQSPEKPNDGEFKSDVNTILHGTSVQNRKEMCELEYMKARRLLKNPTVETVARAKNIMNTLATDFDYLPAVLWMAEFSVNGVKNPEQAAMWYKKPQTLAVRMERPKLQIFLWTAEVLPAIRNLQWSTIKLPPIMV